MRERRETNSMEPTQLPRTNDSDEAAAILAGLQEKKEAGLFCLYPDCLNSRQPSTGKSGRRKGYCSLEEHNITTAFQERQRLKALVEGTAQESSPPAGKGSPTTLKGSIISHILHLQEEVPQYLTALREIEDPDLVLSQIQAVEDQVSLYPWSCRFVGRWFCRGLSLKDKPVRHTFGFRVVSSLDGEAWFCRK